MSNIDGKTRAYFDRLLRLETEAREIAESKKDLTKEMAGVGFSKEDIAGIKLAVRRSFETETKRTSRESAEAVAEALGDFADTPLATSAISRAAGAPAKAARRFVEQVRSHGSDVTLEVPGHAPVHISGNREATP